ncbi:MAG: hypothetical protein ABI763_07430 [Bacteroidota bacterium]
MDTKDEPCADLIFLKKFSKGKKEIVVKYISIFLRTVPPLLQKLQDQIDKKEWQLATFSSHALKTQFNFIGFNSGEVFAQNIQHRLEDKSDLNELTVLLLSLKILCEKLYLELVEEINQLK